MEVGLEGGPLPIRVATEIYFCVFAVWLNDGPHSLMRIKEYHTKRQSEQSNCGDLLRRRLLGRVGGAACGAQPCEGDCCDHLDAFPAMLF